MALIAAHLSLLSSDRSSNKFRAAFPVFQLSQELFIERPGLDASRIFLQELLDGINIIIILIMVIIINPFKLNRVI